MTRARLFKACDQPQAGRDGHGKRLALQNASPNWEAATGASYKEILGQWSPKL